LTLSKGTSYLRISGTPGLPNKLPEINLPIFTADAPSKVVLAKSS
jgi:hypothetical protein